MAWLESTEMSQALLGGQGLGKYHLSLGYQRADSSGFGTRLLLPEGFAVTAEFCPSLLLLYVGEPLLARVVIDVVPFQHLTSLGGNPHHAWVPQGKLGTLIPSPLCMEHLPAAWGNPAAMDIPRTSHRRCERKA